MLEDEKFCETCCAKRLHELLLPRVAVQVVVRVPEADEVERLLTVSCW